MRLDTLLDDILGIIEPEEWKALDEGAPSLAVSAFNRATLLRLRDLEPPDGEADAGQVKAMRSQLEAYLRDQLPDKPEAHRYIIASCLGLAFILREPLHPIAPTGIRFRVQDATATYYCPIREDHDDSLCTFCACRGFNEWEELTRSKVDACGAPGQAPPAAFPRN